MLKTLSLVSCIVVLAGSAIAQTPPPATPFVLKELGPGVYAAIDGPENKSGSNAGFIIGDDGVLVVDAFQTPVAAKALLDEIRKLTPKPIKFVVNTHYHYDHVMGDSVFAEAGATIVTHPNARVWERTENLNLLGSRASDSQKTAIANLPLAGLTTKEPITFWLGSKRIDVRPEKGHTGGDLVVYVPDAHVLFCGDLLWRKVSPNLIDGTVKDWAATDGAFAKLPDAASMKYVPGHGDVATAADVTEFQGYLNDLSAFTKAARAKKLEGDALVAEVLPKMKAKYGSWLAFDYFASKEIGFMSDELAGKKRVPPVPKE
ncbi:MAG TPA: MBL fold metallo-hydrolase [Hyphomonadaceae bacterium]|nr:MBL fold metallo-hydrolase [Hyphomonadaceae bacterium]